MFYGCSKTLKTCLKATETGAQTERPCRTHRVDKISMAEQHLTISVWLSRDTRGAKKHRGHGNGLANAGRTINVAFVWRRRIYVVTLLKIARNPDTTVEYISVIVTRIPSGAWPSSKVPFGNIATLSSVAYRPHTTTKIIIISRVRGPLVLMLLSVDMTFTRVCTIYALLRG